MHAGLELQGGYGRRVHVDQSQRRMVGHEMAAAPLAVLTLADRRLLVHRDVLGAFGHADRIRLPERKCIHRTAGPRTARTAVTIAHALRLARDLDLHRAAETLAAMRRHLILPAFVVDRIVAVLRPSTIDVS